MKSGWFGFCMAFAALVLAQPSRSAAPSSSSDETGSWEGEIRGDPWPIFAALHLARSDGTLDGTLDIRGQSIAITEARWQDDRLLIRAGEAPDAPTIDARRDDAGLTGTIRIRGRELLFAFRRFQPFPPPADRLDAWRQDLDTLSTRFLAAERSFSPDARRRFLESIAETRRLLPTLGDDAIIMRMASAIALGGNAHSRLYTLRNRTALRRLPIRVWLFSDGLRIVRTTEAYRSLLGCRIDRIGTLTVAQARQRVAPIFAGNAQWQDYMATYSLTSPEALHGLGIVRDPEAIDLALGDCGRRRASVTPLPLARSNSAVEAWWDLTPARSTEGWVQALAGAGEPLPFYLRNPDRNYWFEFEPTDRILYFNYQRAQDAAEEDTAAFGARLMAELARLRPTALVLDLRFNTGGNLELARSLMLRLEEATRGIPRYLIVGRATFSAGISQAALWRQAGPVAIVGEPVGDSLDYWSEGGNIRLPNSGLDAHFANGAHSYSMAPCPAGIPCLDMSVDDLDPDLPTGLSWSDYIASRDPAMAAIAADLRSRR